MTTSPKAHGGPPELVQVDQPKGDDGFTEPRTQPAGAFQPKLGIGPATVGDAFSTQTFSEPVFGEGSV